MLIHETLKMIAISTNTYKKLCQVLGRPTIHQMAYRAVSVIKEQADLDELCTQNKIGRRDPIFVTKIKKFLQTAEFEGLDNSCPKNNPYHESYMSLRSANARRQYIKAVTDNLLLHHLATKGWKRSDMTCRLDGCQASVESLGHVVEAHGHLLPADSRLASYAGVELRGGSKRVALQMDSESATDLALLFADVPEPFLSFANKIDSRDARDHPRKRRKVNSDKPPPTSDSIPDNQPNQTSQENLNMPQMGRSPSTKFSLAGNSDPDNDTASRAISDWATEKDSYENNDVNWVKLKDKTTDRVRYWDVFCFEDGLFCFIGNDGLLDARSKIHKILLQDEGDKPGMMVYPDHLRVALDRLCLKKLDKPNEKTGLKITFQTGDRGFLAEFSKGNEGTPMSEREKTQEERRKKRAVLSCDNKKKSLRSSVARKPARQRDPTAPGPSSGDYDGQVENAQLDAGPTTSTIQDTARFDAGPSIEVQETNNEIITTNENENMVETPAQEAQQPAPQPELQPAPLVAQEPAPQQAQQPVPQQVQQQEPEQEFQVPPHHREPPRPERPTGPVTDYEEIARLRRKNDRLVLNQRKKIPHNANDRMKQELEDGYRLDDLLYDPFKIGQQIDRLNAERKAAKERKRLGGDRDECKHVLEVIALRLNRIFLRRKLLLTNHYVDLSISHAGFVVSRELNRQKRQKKKDEKYMRNHPGLEPPRTRRSGSHDGRPGGRNTDESVHDRLGEREPEHETVFDRLGEADRREPVHDRLGDAGS